MNQSTDAPRRSRSRSRRPRSLVVGPALVLLMALTVAVCSDGTGPPPAEPTSLAPVGAGWETGTAGEALADSVVVRVLDQHGQPLPGVSVMWIVTHGGGSVSPLYYTTDAGGDARASWMLGTVAGQNRLTARVAGLPDATFESEGQAGDVVSVVVVPADTILLPGWSHPFTVATADRFGNAIGDPPQPTWSSSDASVATVDGDGVVAALTAGDVVITGEVASVAGTAAVTVMENLPPLVIETVSLTTRATRPSTSELAVTGGVPPYAWSVAAGDLPAGLTLSAEGAISGAAEVAGSYLVRLRVDDAEEMSVEADLDIMVCDAPLDLAVGEQVTWSFPDHCGVVLLEGSWSLYRLGVTATDYRTTRAVNHPVADGLRLDRLGEVAVAGAPVARAAAPGEPLHRHVHGEDDALDPETRELIRRTEALHHRLRREELLESIDDPPHVLGPRDPALEQEARDYEPEQSRTFFTSNPNGSGRIEIQAALRAMSDNILYYQDDSVVGTADEATDQEIQNVLDFYDDHGKPVIDELFGGLGPEGTTDNFLGGPRLTDDLDGNGRFIILQLSRDNMLANAAGYVSSCDRRPAPGNATSGVPTCTGSNEAEITYILRPSSNFYLGIVVHEAKHISSHGYAIFANRGFHESWIEEGTAEIAKEFASRRAAGFDYTQELRFADIYPAGSTPPATHTGMAQVQSRARSFLRAAPFNGIIGNPKDNPNNSTYYGASWLFHRYLADAYAGNDIPGFFLDMNTRWRGLNAIQQATARDFADLVSEFLLAVAVEGYGDARQAARHRFTSYDFANIAARFVGGPWPYVQWTGGFGTGSTDIEAFYTGTSFFDITSADDLAQRLDLLTADGGALDGAVGGVITITRIQ